MTYVTAPPRARANAWGGMERVTDYLEADHQRLHALLDSGALAEFRAGLLRHIAIEEKLLFPAVRRALGRPLDAALRLRVEHAALTSLLVPTPDPTLVAEIRALLARHDAKEEGPDGVYAACEAILGATDELAKRARSFKQVPVSPYYDGPEAHRTAASALASAERIAANRKPRP